MGVRGLTTFIENNSHRYLENYQLSDTTLVADGFGIACQLYVQCRKNERNDCFGGNYDKYRVVVEDFFRILKACNITPLIIFDGGYEERKMKTVLTRMKERIKSVNVLCRRLKDGTVFPLLVKDLFGELAIKNGIKCVKCEFEADSEMACLARNLKCPLLSYDSDFYIFDVPYIPFPSMDLWVPIRRTAGKKYIQCKVYHVEKLLDSFGGMDKLNLPVLAVLLGNDYVQKKVFTAFFERLNVQKQIGGGSNEQQKLIKTLIMWLKNETPESAIMKVVRVFQQPRRGRVASIIESAIKGYHVTNSELLKHFHLELETVELNFPKIEDIESMSEVEDEGARGGAAAETDFEDFEMEKCKKSVMNLPQFFRDDFSNCLYPGCFMDMITTSTYYCIAQIEDFTQNHSHTLSLNIISAIHKILTGKNELQIVGRDGTGIEKSTLPPYHKKVPVLKNLEHLSVTTCKAIFLDILDIDDSLSTFPQSWHLLIITIKYWIKHAKVNLSSIYSILLCAIVVNCVDQKIGFYRSTKPFLNRYKRHTSLATYTPETNITKALDRIDLHNSVASMKKLIDFFQMQYRLRTNPELFDRAIVHDFAVFQSCLSHIKQLNSLLKFPFRQLAVSQFYNGTFLYNMTVNLNRKTNMDAYVEVLLKDSPNVLNVFKLMAAEMKKYAKKEGKARKKRTERRRTRRKKIGCEQDPPLLQSPCTCGLCKDLTLSLKN